MKKAELQVLSGVVIRKKHCEEKAGTQAALMEWLRNVFEGGINLPRGRDWLDFSGAERRMGSPLSLASQFVRLASQCNLHSMLTEVFVDHDHRGGHGTRHAAIP
jgi:hypothetical protein